MQANAPSIKLSYFFLFFFKKLIVLEPNQDFGFKEEGATRFFPNLQGTSPGVNFFPILKTLNETQKHEEIKENGIKILVGEAIALAYLTCHTPFNIDNKAKTAYVYCVFSTIQVNVFRLASLFKNPRLVNGQSPFCCSSKFSSKKTTKVL